LPHRPTWELAEIAVDLALTGLQLIFPDEQRISRMYGRTVPQLRVRVSEHNGHLGSSWTNHAPGHVLPPGTLREYIANNARAIASVGNRINAFISTNHSLPRLNLAWSDAAYWFHEGLAEPLDAIAVPKLETAIEVLMRSEIRRKSGTSRYLDQSILWP